MECCYLLLAKTRDPFSPALEALSSASGENFPSYFSPLQPWKLDHTGLVTPTFAANPHGSVTHSPSPTSDGVTSSFLMTVEKDLEKLLVCTNFRNQWKRK